MAKYLYRIKGFTCVQKGDEFINPQWAYDVTDTGLVEANSRAEARRIVEETHGAPMVMRSKAEDIGTKHPFLLTIFEIEPDSYWDKYWNERRECEWEGCNNIFTKLEQKQNGAYGYCCSEECSKLQEQKRLAEWVEFNEARSKYGGQIYKITNKTTGMCYIGQTTQPFTLRWWQHVAHNGTEKFGGALKRSKITDWTFELLQVGIDIDELNEQERYYIRKFDSVANGYNSV